MKNRFLMILAFLFLGLFLSGGFFTGRVMANTVGIYLDSSGFVPDSDTTMDGYMFGVANDTSSNLSGYYINAYSLDGSTVIPDQGIHLFSNDYVYDSGTGTFSLVGNAATLSLDSARSAYLSYWDDTNKIENGILADATGVSVGSINYTSGIYYGLTVDSTGSFIDGPLFVDTNGYDTPDIAGTGVIGHERDLVVAQAIGELLTRFLD